MKVLHLASGDLWAGAEVQLFHLASQLATTPEIDLLVVLLNKGQLEQELIRKGIEVLVLDESRHSSMSIFVRLYQIVKQHKPDIIHTHRIKENVLGGLIAKITRCKSIRTAHGASELTQSPNLRSQLFSLLDKFSGRFLQSKIIAVSEELKTKLQDDYPATKIEAIANSVDIDHLLAKADEPIEFDSTAGQFNVVFIGRFVPVKRSDIFYAIAKACIENYPALNIHFYMLGDGPLHSVVLEKIKQDGLEDKIHLLGFVQNTLPLLKKMNLLCFTSDHEGLPMTLLEAMALKVPVLSRNLKTIRHVLCKGACGYFISRDDVSAYSEIIASIAKEKSASLDKAQAAYEVLYQAYAIKINVLNYIKVYEEITNNR